MDSTSQVINIPHLGVELNVLTNPPEKKSREVSSGVLAGQEFGPSFSVLSILAYFDVFYDYKMTSGHT